MKVSSARTTRGSTGGYTCTVSASLADHISRLVSTVDAVKRFLRNPGEYLLKPSLVITVLGLFGLYAYSALL